MPDSGVCKDPVETRGPAASPQSTADSFISDSATSGRCPLILGYLIILRGFLSVFFTAMSLVPRPSAWVRVQVYHRLFCWKEKADDVELYPHPRNASVCTAGHRGLGTEYAFNKYWLIMTIVSNSQDCCEDEAR
jgi:hypothetical protein